MPRTECERLSCTKPCVIPSAAYAGVVRSSSSWWPLATHHIGKQVPETAIIEPAKQVGYEFNNGSGIAGVMFIEIQKIVDLPPERNGKSRRAVRGRR